MVDKVLGRGAILGPRRDICIVSVHDYIGGGVNKRRHKELERPEHIVFGGPGMVRAAVETVNEYDVGGGARMGIDRGGLESLDEFRV